MSDEDRSPAREYETVWAHDGARITAAMEAASGLKFEDRAVKAMVLEVSSSSGYKEKPMQLRASYPLDTKKATLIHELGHRLQSDLFHHDEDDHKYLFLWIYDVWIKLYGREFADARGEVAEDGLHIVHPSPPLVAERQGSVAGPAVLTSNPGTP